MQKHFNKILTVLLSTVFLTVFIRNNEVVDSLTAKTFYFYFISIIIFSVVFIKLLLEKREIEIYLSKLDVLILAYYFYNFIRLVFTEYVPINNEKFINLTLLVGYYFLLKILLNNKKDENYSSIVLISAFLLTGFFQSIIGMLQFYNLFGFTSNYYRAIGSFSAMASYSSFIISTLPFAFGIFMLSKERTTGIKILKYLGMITFIAGVLILPIIKIRGDWLAMLSGIAFVLLIKYNIVSKFDLFFSSKLKKTLILVSSIALSLILIWGLYRMRPASAFGRILIWKVSTNIITDHPVIGAGFDTFGDIYNNYQAKYFAEKDRAPFEIYVADNVSYAHNDFLEVFAELGAIGLVLFILIIIFTIRKTKGESESNRNKYIVLSAKASIIGMVISSQFTFPFQILPTLLNFIFLLSIVSVFEKNIVLISFKIKNIKLKAIGLFGVFLAVFFLFDIVESYNANKNWQKAITLSKYKKYDLAIKLYSESYSELKTNGNFLLNYGGTLSLADKNNKAIEILSQAKNKNSSNNLYILLGNSNTELGKFEEAEKAYKYASNIVPNRLYPKYMLAKMYVKEKKIDKAKVLAAKIIETDAKIPSIAEKEIKNEMLKILEL